MARRFKAESSQPHSWSGDHLALADKFSQFIVVSAQSFTQRNLDRFGASWLLERHKSVHLIDLSLLVWGERGIRADQPDAVEGVLRPVNWKSVEDFLSQHGPDSLLLLYVLPKMAPPLFELMAKYSISTLYFDSSRLPLRRGFAPTMRMVAHLLASDPKHLWRKAVGKLRTPTHPKLSLDYLVMGGKASELHPPAWVKDARIAIPSHSYDYVIWDSSPPFAYDDPYIVFLDQAYPDHSDPVKLKIANPFTRELYYLEMENFLHHVSAKFRMPVLVALHPRSSRTNGPTPYRGFQTFLGCTASLVKGARLVIAHDTAAISFAVLGRKPLLLVKMDQMKQWYAGNLIGDFARALDAPMSHISDRQLPNVNHLQVDASKYASYEAMYIRHPSCNGIYIWDRIFGSLAKGEEDAG